MRNFSINTLVNWIRAMSSLCPDCKSALKGAGLRCACGWRASGMVEPPRAREPERPPDPHKVMAARRELHKILNAPRAEFPGNDWASKILDRHLAGEKVSNYALLMAREALGLERMREPGEDG